MERDRRDTNIRSYSVAVRSATVDRLMEELRSWRSSSMKWGQGQPCTVIESKSDNNDESVHSGSDHERMSQVSYR